MFHSMYAIMLGRPPMPNTSAELMVAFDTPVSDVVRPLMWIRV